MSAKISDETKMLNIAAAERTLLRTALGDCATILQRFKERDDAMMSGKSLRWMPGEPAAMALNNARQILSPRPDLRPLRQKEAHV